MKKNIFLFFVLIISYSAKSQGNLQFNQVLNFDLTVTSTTVGYRTQSIAVTVPAGKVWKVVSASAGYGNNDFFPNGYDDLQIRIDNVPYFYHVSMGNFYGQLSNILPLWLNAGSHSVSLTFKYSYSGIEEGAFGKVSIIEFNVVP
jgi:hypothetical protein